MTTYGLTDDGFVPETLEIVEAGLTASIEAAFGITVAAAPAFHELIGILAERLSLLWEQDEAIYASQDPDSATGAALDAVCALTGTVRDPATASTVQLTLTGDDAVVVAAGSQVSTATLGAGDKFETLTAVTLAAVPAWQAIHVYQLDDIVTNVARCYVCITAGSSGAIPGPTTTSDDITDGIAHWRYLGEGTASIDVAAESVETGTIPGVSGTINYIETPIANWDSVINLLDATLGNDVETDGVLRLRRETELSAPGTGTIPALYAALADVEDVTNIRLFVNNTDLVDGDGLPPHSVEAVVLGGADQDIWDCLYDNVAAGIATFGAEAGVVTDDSGTAQDYYFTRPTPVLIYVEITVTYDVDLYPIDGDAQIAAAIVAWGDAQKPGKDVVAVAIEAQAMSVAGVLDVTVYNQDIVTPAVLGETTIAIAIREIAVYDTARITVTSGAATP